MVQSRLEKAARFNIFCHTLVRASSSSGRHVFSCVIPSLVFSLQLHWMRAARTDKGVSAVGQVVSLRMILDPPGMVERINESLPRQIRVFGYGRATNGFDARKHCDKRRYEYILPVWAFDPDVCLLSKEAGAAVAADGEVERDAAAAPRAAEDDSAAAALPELSPAELAELESTAEAQSASYAFDAAEQARVTAILRQYEGTHNFHNFTVRTGAHEAQARRYILSFRCEGVTEIAGSRWVRLVVVGQSFMLHQIRKMVGMALAVARGLAPADSIRQALLSRDTLHTPMAPELGLFLDECYFDAYNTGFGERLHEALVLSDFQRPVAEFKAAWLYPHIAQTDATEHINASWIRQLHTLSFEPGAWALRSSGTRGERRRMPWGGESAAAAHVCESFVQRPTSAGWLTGIGRQPLWGSASLQRRRAGGAAPRAVASAAKAARVGSWGLRCLRWI